MKPQLDRVQLSTIVAALRHWQNSSLTIPEIDQLCELLSFKTMKPQLDCAQLSTIVAALRHWQNSYDKGVLEEFADYFEPEEPLTISKIDELCETLNFDY